MAESTWSAQDTTPGEIVDGLSGLLAECFARGETVAPARVLNLVAIVDGEWRGEILNRLDRVGRYHPSRTVLCVVEEGRTTIDAHATIAIPDGVSSEEPAPARERVELDVGPGHLGALGSIVDPLVVTDIATVVWSPHGHPDAVDSLLSLAQVVLLDSVAEPDPGVALARAHELAGDAYLVDLAWLRSTPWRERVAATFDPPAWRAELDRVTSVRVRHHPDSLVPALLFCGWLTNRLGWPLDPDAEGAVDLGWEIDATMTVPGLSGVTVETSSGLSISLDRGPGGLSARRRAPNGTETAWTVLGASRGEAGILGEGIRQALLRDQNYGPALSCANVLLARGQG